MANPKTTDTALWVPAAEAEPRPTTVPGRLVQVWTRQFPYENLTYLWPEAAGVEPQVGLRVVVPLRNRRVTGYVVDPQATPLDRPGVRYKPVDLVLDPQPLCPPTLVRLLRWAADYYLQPLGAYLHLAIPPGLHALHRAEVRITPAGLQAAAEWAAGARQRRLPLWARVLLYVAEARKATLPKVRRAVGSRSLHAAVQYLRARGWVEVRERLHQRAKVPKTTVVHLVRPPADGERVPGAYRDILTYLTQAGRDVLLEELAEQVRDAESSGADPQVAQRRLRDRLRRMVARGWIQVYVQYHPRPIVWDAPVGSEAPVVLNDEQRAVLESLQKYVEAGTFHAGVLYGVTGSGKTEVYLRLIEAAVRRGKTALVLMPEIALIPAVTQRFRRQFGDLLAVLHSEMTPAQRTSEWWRIRTGEARIVLGARSAIFAPLEDVGVLVVDEEQDGSYRQDELPVYNAREVALARARFENAVALLVTATPSVETYAHARQGTYGLYRLTQRAVPGAVLPEVVLVDMRDAYARGSHPFFSPLLMTSLRETLDRGETAIVLINRRGYAPFVQCRACGHVLTCSQCSIHMVLHKKAGVLRCHYCDATEPVPKRCPVCERPYLIATGIGTERVQALLEREFPDVRVGVLDRDTLSRPRELFRLLGDFYEGRVQVLVGTQMVAKGHHFPRVTLVGVLEADTSTGLPDFRSHERLFQLITQVVGRSGRADRPGRAIIQTYRPEHYAIRYACQHDYEGFFREELAYRQRFQYPPFTSIVLLTVVHPEHALARQYAQTLTELLTERSIPQTQVHGPVQPLLWRLQGKYRYHVLIRTTDRRAVRQALRDVLGRLPFRRDFLRVQVDPYELV
ncbi:Primosomal protein N' [bacterium HR11]|nr:Primosomal protein N' [bacterium HR11]